MKHIAIIGAGQLGSRHLQALNLVNIDLSIQVVDPCKSALKTARVRFEETIKDRRHPIEYQTELKFKQDMDLVIIASTSSHRRGIIESLLSQVNVNYLVLEKLLFDKFDDYEQVSHLLEKHSVQAWVNCPMRQMPFYQSLSAFFQQQPLKFNVTGSQYGLVTNAIHYLDYLAFLSDDNDFSLDLTGLNHEIIPSKRAGYYELTGTLSASFSKGSKAFLHCDKEGTAPVQIDIYSSKNRVISREWEQVAWLTGEHCDWQWQEQEAAIPYQSQLTAELVNDLLQNKGCLLPEFKNSVKTHLQLLPPLSQFLSNQKIRSHVDFPFT